MTSPWDSTSAAFVGRSPTNRDWRWFHDGAQTELARLQAIEAAEDASYG